nr:unnamed protein product [Callosobruchus analis]
MVLSSGLNQKKIVQNLNVLFVEMSSPMKA